MRAGFIDQPGAAFCIAEGDEVFTKQTHAHGVAIGFCHFLGKAGGDPVAAHHLPHRCAAFDAGEQFVFFGGEHGRLRG